MIMVRGYFADTPAVREALSSALDQEEGYTLFQADGAWGGKPEKSLVVALGVFPERVGKTLCAFQEILARAGEEAVLIEVQGTALLSTD